MVLRRSVVVSSSPFNFCSRSFSTLRRLFPLVRRRCNVDPSPLSSPPLSFSPTLSSHIFKLLGECHQHSSPLLLTPLHSHSHRHTDTAATADRGRGRGRRREREKEKERQREREAADDTRTALAHTQTCNAHCDCGNESSRIRHSTAHHTHTTDTRHESLNFFYFLLCCCCLHCQRLHSSPSSRCFRRRLRLDLPLLHGLLLYRPRLPRYDGSDRLDERHSPLRCGRTMGRSARRNAAIRNSTAGEHVEKGGKRLE